MSYCKCWKRSIRKKQLRGVSPYEAPQVKAYSNNPYASYLSKRRYSTDADGNPSTSFILSRSIFRMSPEVAAPLPSAAADAKDERTAGSLMRRKPSMAALQLLRDRRLIPSQSPEE